MSRESGIGGGIIAMAGKKCVAIASDLRYGWGYQVTTKTFHKIFPINSKCLFGAQGLYTDIQTVYEKSRFNANMYRLREGREINGKQFICSTGHLLYKNRFASYSIGSVVCGLDENGDGICSSYDGIGAYDLCKFACSGRCLDQLMGTVNSFYKEDMEPEELVNVITHCMKAASERCPFTGFGIEVYLLTQDELKHYVFKTRQD